MLTKRYAQINFITAVGGASTTGLIWLAPGLYHLFVIGTHAASTTDPTLQFNAVTNAAQTAVTPLACGLSTDTALAAAMDLELGQTALYGVIGNQPVGTVDTGGPDPVLVPFGAIQFVYTKNGGTAVDLTLVAVPADPASL